MNVLAIFCAKQLVYIEALLGLVAIAGSLPQRRHLVRRRWLVCSLVLFLTSGLLALVLGHFIHDPRPFVSDGLPSLIPHAANNGFPSHHALLAAAVVAMVALLDVRKAVLLSVLGLAVQWGRVACHVHHASDVLGSDVIVLLATVVGLACARQIKEFRGEESLEEYEPQTRRPSREIRSSVQSKSESA